MVVGFEVDRFQNFRISREMSESVVAKVGKVIRLRTVTIISQEPEQNSAPPHSPTELLPTKHGIAGFGATP